MTAAQRHLVALVAFLLLLFLGFFLLPRVAEGRPTIKTSFFNVYTAANGSRLDDVLSRPDHCGVCHYDFSGGGARNPYGVRLGNVLGNYANNDAGRQQAVRFIEMEDSDGDGFSNRTEITELVLYNNTPTFPGLNGSNIGLISNVTVSEVLPYQVPATGPDLVPPVVTVLSPNGAEIWTGGSPHSITWTATDVGGVVAVDIDFRESETDPWTPLVRNAAPTGSWTWFVHNLPGTATRVRVVARDAAGNAGSDSSNAVFTILRTPGGIVPSTLRDFHLAGTQPFGASGFVQSADCRTCHGGYDQAAEPGHGFRGSMMALAGRDPLFEACMAVAEQDAPSSGDLCLRCHSPFGWLAGRSNPTGGQGLVAADLDGVSCDFCHRSVDPLYVPGVSPPEDQAVLAMLDPFDVPTGHSSGQFVVDPDPRKRGPFSDAQALHQVLESDFHRTSNICGTCHDVSNPAFEKVADGDYAPNAFDAAPGPLNSAVHLPLERTYSEWKNSAYPAGVYAPEFAGAKPDGIVKTCQDCHMSDVVGRGCTEPEAPIRANLPFHDMTGGNTWMPPIIAALFPADVDAQAAADASDRARIMLEKSAVLDLLLDRSGGNLEAVVTVTNRTGHKLPTGYPEGRRMWLHVTAFDAADELIFESGAYDPDTGVLTHDAHARIYEAELGISPALAQAVGAAAGPSFHFVLNDTVYKDNRIPPIGFTNAAFAAFGGRPVETGHGTPRYPDGQYWDVATYPIPAAATRVEVELLYQTTSKEYVEFLRDENVTNDAGDVLYALWEANGRAAPVVMASEAALIDVSAVPETDGPGGAPRLAAARNPFRGALELRLDLPEPAPVRLDVIDVLGRRVAAVDFGSLGGGAHRLAWDGRTDSGREAAPGLYWARVTAGAGVLTERVVRVN
jgi:hypothetical protein